MNYRREKLNLECCDCSRRFRAFERTGRCPECQHIQDSLTPEQKESQRLEALVKVRQEFMDRKKEILESQKC